MSQSKPQKSNPTDLSALDGSALLARLAWVKVRVLEDAAALARPFDASEDPTEARTAKSPEQISAEIADTKAVLDECAERLLGPGPAAGQRQHRAEAEVKRLRGLIWAVVDTQTRLAFKTGCPGCASQGAHKPGCPWVPLAAEAERP